MQDQFKLFGYNLRLFVQFLKWVHVRRRSSCQKEKCANLCIASNTATNPSMAPTHRDRTCNQHSSLRYTGSSHINLYRSIHSTTTMENRTRRLAPESFPFISNNRTTLQPCCKWSKRAQNTASFSSLPISDFVTSNLRFD